MVDVRTVRVKPTKGKDLPHINETIFDDPIFIHKLHNKITEIAAQVNPAQADGWRKAWEEINKRSSVR